MHFARFISVRHPSNYMGFVVCIFPCLRVSVLEIWVTNGWFLGILGLSTITLRKLLSRASLFQNVETVEIKMKI